MFCENKKKAGDDIKSRRKGKKVAIGCRTGVKTHVSAIVEDSIYSFKSRKVIETLS